MSDLLENLKLKIERVPTSKLIPYVNNARTHSEAQVSQIAASISEFGFVNPILIGEDNIIIAGHGRLMAAQLLGLETIPAIKLEHLSETQRRALIIADNKITENAGWDEELLRLELQTLQSEMFDLDVLGFSDEDLDALLLEDEEGSGGLTEEDAVPDVPEKPVSVEGDIWICGNHKVICGDSLLVDTLDKLMGQDLADMVFTDPPYNVNYGNSVKDNMRVKAGKSGGRKIKNDNLGKNFPQFLYDACTNMLMYCKGALYICMSTSELVTLQDNFAKAGGKWSTFIVWAKNHFTLGGSDYQRQYEPILYGWKQGNDHYWCGARDQGDLWHYNKPNVNDLHPTMKPVELVERAIRNSSKTSDIVLDAFGGSGTTMIACEITNRRCRMVELDPKYVDVIVKRWQEYTGQNATLAGSGQCFSEVDDARV